MPIYSPTAFTGELKPVIIPSGAGGNNAYMNNMMSSTRKANEDDGEILGVKTSSLNNGMYGQNRVVNFQLLSLEAEKRKMKEEAFDVIMNGKTDREKQVALNNYHRGLMGLKSKALELSVLSEELKDDRVNINKDYEYAQSKGELYNPTLLANVGGMIASKNEGRFSDGTTFAQNELWNNSINGLAAVRNGRAITKSQYMNELDSNTMTDENGRPIRYRAYQRASTTDVYKENIRTNMNVKGSRAGDSFSMINDEGKTVSVGDREMEELIQGRGYTKTSVSSNAAALNNAVENMFNHLSDNDRNRAFEDLLQSGEYSKQISYKGITKNEVIGPQTYAGLVEELQKTRYQYEVSKNPTEREALHRKGLAISDQLIKGVKLQVYRDATDYKKDYLQTSVKKEVKVSSDKYLDQVAVDASFALLNPKNVSVLPTASAGTTVWENGKLKNYQTGAMAWTQSLKGQNQYLEGNGIFLNDKDYAKKPKTLFDLTDTFLFSSRVQDRNKMDAKTREQIGKWEIIGLDNHVRVMPPIEGGQISRISDNTTYIGVRVKIPNPNDVTIPLPIREEKDGKVRYSEGKEKYSIKDMTKAGMVQGIEYNETTKQYEAVVMVPMNWEHTYDNKPTSRNVKMMRNAQTQNELGWAMDGSNVFKEDDIVSESTTDNSEWFAPNDNLPATEENLRKYLKQKTVDDAEKRNNSFGSRASFL